MARKDSLKKLRDVLIRRRDAIRSALEGDLSLLQQLAQDGGDVMDIAMDTAQDEISSQLAEVESSELKRIDEALAKFSDGSFGQCEGCDKPIPLARLQVLPYAPLCIGCQRDLEAGKLFLNEENHELS